MPLHAGHLASIGFVVGRFILISQGAPRRLVGLWQAHCPSSSTAMRGRALMILRPAD